MSSSRTPLRRGDSTPSGRVSSRVSPAGSSLTSTVPRAQRPSAASVTATTPAHGQSLNYTTVSSSMNTTMSPEEMKRLRARVAQR